MTSSRAVEFRVLGPLEMSIAGEPVALGGAKQRAVLSVLLLHAGEVVPVGRLVEEVWGDDPPPSATHTLESYVSRLRQLFNGHGPGLVRRGAGYVIELGDATLDARSFVELQERATLAAALDEHADVVELTAAALGIWRGPALADVVLASAGRAEAERLEELRLRTYELRFDSELALGQHERAVGELQALAARNPYRERFVAQLMLALYRAGRHAEALDAYEQTRRRLDDDLGLQPSADLQQLSGQVVRQDPALQRPASTPAIARRTADDRKPRHTSLVAAAGAAVAAALALAASGGAAVAEPVEPTDQRLVLVLPGSPDALGVAAKNVSTTVRAGEILHALETQTVSVDPRAPHGDVDGVAAHIENHGVGLVVALGDGPTSRALAEVVPRLPRTRFVFIDASLSELSLEGVRNAAAVRFATEDAIHLSGYVSGLMPTMDGSKRRVDQVSVVAGEPTRDTKRLIAAFRRGTRETRPGVKVRVEYSHELEDPTACERLANRQIDAGSDVVFAAAGRCGLGAAEVARLRGVWSIGGDEDGILPGPHVLVSIHKRWTDATLHAVEELVEGSLPMGRDTVLGLEDDYAVLLETSSRIPKRIDSALVARCSRITATRHRDID